MEKFSVKKLLYKICTVSGISYGSYNIMNSLLASNKLGSFSLYSSFATFLIPNLYLYIMAINEEPGDANGDFFMITVPLGIVSAPIAGVISYTLCSYGKKNIAFAINLLYHGFWALWYFGS